MDPSLYSAARIGNIGDGDFLLADHLKRDEENSYQLTPKVNMVFHVAALYGHSHFAAEVLKITPALLCCQIKKNETSLHIAANEGHTEVVRVLLACVEDLNTKEKLMRMMDTSGDKALHKALRSQHLDVVKLLVKEDHEFEFPANHAHERPLYLAAESGFHDALINILESCKKLSNRSAGPSKRPPLHGAVIQKHKDCIRSLWRWNKPLCEEPDLWGWNSLHYAIKLGLADIVSDMMACKKSLVYLPAGSENDWTTAIHIAFGEGDVNMIEKLLNHHPDCRDTLSSDSQNALHVTVLNNQDEVHQQMQPLHMEPKTSNAQTVDQNLLNALVANHESLSLDVARVNAGLDKLGVEVASISGRMERVEIQQIYRPSTPKNTSLTFTPKATHPRMHPTNAIPQANYYSQGQGLKGPSHSLHHQVPHEGIGTQMKPLNPTPPNQN
ncbi:hypothetical protein CQW23_13253 [Capsicum baccatum]|uniref:Uncharacterized protein n=1 Tax=Capsicum baccatum TaxID=33114 RepID=A0A2G2WUX6_CAPBA|nr:hypothetical protein CQW23_13253 [Capsicum baccatum]